MAHRRQPSPAQPSRDTPTTPVKQPGITPSDDHDRTPLKDTPFIMKIDSRQDTKQSRLQLSTSIRAQAIKGRHIVPIPDLDTICFGLQNVDLVKGCLEYLTKAGVVQQPSDSVYNYPVLSDRKGREAEMYPSVIKMFNLIGGYFEASPTSNGTPIPEESARYEWTNTSSASRLKAPNLKRYPDISMIPRRTDDTKCSIGDLLIPLEFKKSPHDDASHQVIEQYRAISSVQINRCFTYCLSLRFPQFTLWRLDRSNALSSRVIDMTKDLPQVIHIIGSLMSLNYAELGYYDHTWKPETHPGGPSIRFRGTMDIPPVDPSSSETSETDSATDGLASEPTTPATSDDEDMYLEVVESLKEPRGWLGRCTYVAKVRDPVTNEILAFKVSWQDPKRTSEGAFYIAARQAGVVIGLAEIIGYQELPSISTFRIGMELVEFEDRKQCRLLLRTMGESLAKCTSIVHLIGAVRDAMICHRDLAQKAGLLHRDVSYNNILLQNDVKKQARIGRGILIDLEYAKKLQRDQDNVGGRHSRTGTLAFMAAALLEDPTPVHAIHHDLESFFWVLLFVCSDSPIWMDVDPCDKDTTPTYRLNTIFQQSTAMQSLVNKTYWMTSDSPIVLSSRFMPLVPHFSKLRDLFALEHPKWPKLVPGAPLPTHESFLRILDDVLEDRAIKNAATFRPEDIPVPVPIPTVLKQSRIITTSELAIARSSAASSQKRGSDMAQLGTQEERPSNRRRE